MMDEDMGSGLTQERDLLFCFMVTPRYVYHAVNPQTLSYNIQLAQRQIEVQYAIQQQFRRWILSAAQVAPESLRELRRVYQQDAP